MVAVTVQLVDPAFTVIGVEASGDEITPERLFHVVRLLQGEAHVYTPPCFANELINFNHPKYPTRVDLIGFAGSRKVWLPFGSQIDAPHGSDVQGKRHPGRRHPY